MKKAYMYTVKIIIQVYFRVGLYFRTLFSKNDKQIKTLKRDGILIIKNSFNKDIIHDILSVHEKEYLSQVDNGDFQMSKLSLNEDSLLIDELKKSGALGVCKKYLGSNVIYNENHVLHLGSPAYDGEDQLQWQPHHDAKFNRLKVYIWATPYCEKSHPLFFIKKTHLTFRVWNTHSQTRFNVQRGDMFSFRGDLGDIIIFDSHAIHAHEKHETSPRTVINFSLNPTYRLLNFFRKSISKGEKLSL